MSYKTKEEVQQRVQEHYDWAVKEGYEVMGVFLQGSWNYSDLLCDEESDVDTKCWVLPTLEDLALNKKPLSFTHIFENEEHCDVKDFRLYVNCFRKQNVNFVEVLFTDYFVINPKYKDIVEELFKNREAIAHYDTYATISCMTGMIYQKQKDLCRPYKGKSELIERYGYDGKQLSHAIRMYFMMSSYIFGFDYKHCLHIREDYAELLMRVKRYEPLPFKLDSSCNYYGVLSKELAIKSMDELIFETNELRDKFNSTERSIDKSVDELFNKVLIESIRRSIGG